MEISKQKSNIATTTNDLKAQFENDAFCKCLFDIFSKDVLSTKKVRQLPNIKESILKEHTNFFLENSNISLLHTCLTNHNACKVFLLIDEGYNLSQIGKKISIKKGDSRKTIKHWISKYEKLKLIKLASSLSKSRLEVVYEKDYTRETLINLINYICLKNIKTKVRSNVINDITNDIIQRDEI